MASSVDYSGTNFLKQCYSIMFADNSSKEKKVKKDQFLTPHRSISNVIPLQLEMSIIAGVVGYVSSWYFPFDTVVSLVSSSISLSKTCLYDARESPIANRNAFIREKQYVKIFKDDFKEKKKLYNTMSNTALSILMIITACSCNYFYRSFCYTSNNLIADEEMACNSSKKFLGISIAGSLFSIVKTFWSS